ncbi:MAG: DUF3160 domain-containing protein [Myxococcota bacterium]
MHTTPADALGNPLGAVLHEGTDFPHAMVLTIPDDQGKSCAYVGPVSWAHTVRTVDFQRLDDDEWTTRLFSEDVPPMPKWQQEFIHAP